MKKAFAQGKVVGSIEDGVLVKHIKESKHLYWALGGTPCIDADFWDANEGIIQILVTTDKGRTFSMDAKKFNQEKKEINHGSGRQYGVKKEHWGIVTNSKLPEAKIKKQNTLL